MSLAASQHFGAESNPYGFDEKPAAALSLIDPGLKQAGGGYITCTVTKRMNRLHTQQYGFFVLVKFAKHVDRCHNVSIVIADPL